MGTAKQQGQVSFICIILLYILMHLSNVMMQELLDLNQLKLKAHHLKPF